MRIVICGRTTLPAKVKKQMAIKYFCDVCSTEIFKPAAKKSFPNQMIKREYQIGGMGHRTSGVKETFELCGTCFTNVSFALYEALGIDDCNEYCKPDDCTMTAMRKVKQ